MNFCVASEIQRGKSSRKTSDKIKKANNKSYLKLEKPGVLRKNIFACLFSVHNTISLSRHGTNMFN